MRYAFPPYANPDREPHLRIDAFPGNTK